VARDVPPGYFFALPHAGHGRRGADALLPEFLLSPVARQPESDAPEDPGVSRKQMKKNLKNM